MKALFRNLALCLLWCLPPVLAEEELSRVEIQKQLLVALEKDMVGRLANNEEGRILAGNVLSQVSQMRPVAISHYQLHLFDVYNKTGVFSESTDALLKVFREQVISEIETQEEKLSAGFKEKIRGYLTRAMATETFDEVVQVQKELHVYTEKMTRMENREFLRTLPFRGGVQHFEQLLERLREFHAAQDEQEWNKAGSRLGDLEKSAKYVEHYLSAKEYADHLGKLRDSVGIVLPQEFEAFYQKNLDKLFDDANQDRIGEILAGIRKQRSLSGHSSSTRNDRWRQMDSFAVSLMQSIQQVRDGGKPKVSIDSWTRSDASTPALASKDKLMAVLGKYRVKVTGDDGNVTEARLYYTASELRQSASEILDELFDDANQDRLEQIQGRIRALQAFVGSSSEFSGISQHFQQIESLAQNLAQNVRRVQDGGMARVHVDEWLRSGSESGQIIEKKKLTDLLKRYKVKVSDEKGQVREVPLYQDLNDIIARINKLEDIDGELAALAMMSQSSYDSGRGNLAQGVAVLTGLAELHKNLEKGDSFTLSNSQFSEGGDWGGRGGQSGLFSGSVLGSKLETLRNEAERAVLERMLPAGVIEGGDNRDEMVNGLLRRFVEEKNYQGVLVLGRVAAHFQPKRPLFPVHEILAIQHYLDGVRQLEELGEPRLATGHLQQAAAARSGIIPVADLSERLHKLKKEYPEEYEQGTQDALLPERTPTPHLQTQFLILPPLVVPSR